MRLHSLQHADFEGVARIKHWANERKMMLSETLLHEEQSFPKMDEFDFLVIMGGPMSVWEEEKYPWLLDEKRFIDQALQSGKKVLGVCLGSQLLADVLGAKVYANKYQEIGWGKVRLTKEGSNHKVTSHLPSEIEVFHWHGDTFDLPKNATLLASNEVCKNQAYAVGEQVLAFQFHLEMTKIVAQDIVDHFQSNFPKGPYVQKAEEILADNTRFEAMNKLLDSCLDRFIL